MDKPLKDWTLGEMREHCKETTCEKCFVYDLYGGECNLADSAPSDWGLIDLPRWSQEDIEDAKAIKRLRPHTLRITVNRNVIEAAVTTFDNRGGGTMVWCHCDVFPSLKTGECVDLQEILDAEGTLRAMSGGNDDG